MARGCWCASNWSRSKYWHRVQARVCGDELLLTSQAAGGNFAVALDVATCDRRGREIVK